MAKGTSDIILRDRLQFTLEADSDLPLVYGRMDLSDYVNIEEKKGLAIKDIVLQIRDPNNNGAQSENTGIFTPSADLVQATTGAAFSNWKVCVLTRAYESALTIGIASPDVLYIEEWNNNTEVQGAPNDFAVSYSAHNRYSTRDMHPAGYTVVSDLLVGIACDNSETTYASDTFEIDIMIIAEPVTVTQKMLTGLLVQAQDV